MYESRLEKAKEDRNGIELWRKLYVTHEGGAKQVVVSGMSSLHTFPPCANVDDLSDWLGLWNTCRLKYGQYIPEEHLKVMLEERLPATVAKDIRDLRIPTLEGVLNHLEAESVRLNDTKIAQLHSQRIKNSISKKRVNAVTSDVNDDDDSSSDVVRLDSKVDALVEQVSQLVSAIGPRPSGVKPSAKPKPGPKTSAVKRSNLPTPSPSFKGCWHCLSEDHVRRKCPDFQKILKANGGKLPKGYEGAFEKWHKSQKRVAAAILDADDDDDDAESDWSDTDIALTAAIYGQSAE